MGDFGISYGSKLSPAAWCSAYLCDNVYPSLIKIMLAEVAHQEERTRAAKEPRMEMSHSAGHSGNSIVTHMDSII